MAVLSVFEIFQITKVGDGYNSGPQLEFAPIAPPSSTQEFVPGRTVENRLVPVSWVPVTENVGAEIPAPLNVTVKPKQAGSCKDSKDCPSGYACIGNVCILIQSSSSAVGNCSPGGTGGAGGGGGGNDCQSGDCSSLGSGGCSSSSCGGGGGGNPQECCGARCCRFGNPLQPTGCWCCECPVREVCDPFCQLWGGTLGVPELGPGCSENSLCSECEDCDTNGLCVEKPPGSAPCQCKGSECSNCESCNTSGVCFRDTKKCLDAISCEYYCKKTDRTYTNTIQFPVEAFGYSRERAKSACVQLLRKKHELTDCDCPPPNSCENFTFINVCSASGPNLLPAQKITGYASSCIDADDPNGQQIWLVEDCTDGAQNDPDQCCARCSCSTHKDCGPCGFCNGNCECETYENCPESSGGTGTGGPSDDAVPGGQ